MSKNAFLHLVSSLTRRKVFLLFIMLLLSVNLIVELRDVFMHNPVSETTSCIEKSDVIAQALNQANYCIRDTDCIPSPLLCPFKCGYFINAAVDIHDISAKVEAYHAQCGYCLDDCIETQAECINNKCKPLMHS